MRDVAAGTAGARHCHPMQKPLRPQTCHCLQELLGTSGLGHNNPKQKIQYHLRLKQELEEMRRECMALLRERFHLEQAVR